MEITQDLDGTTATANAFFFKGQEPLARDFSPPESISVASDATCFDLRRGDYWDGGSTQENQAIADTRAYYDVGATVTFTDKEGLEQFTLSRAFNATDSSGLTHVVLYQAEDTSGIESYVEYRPLIAGSAAYPELDLVNGVFMTGVRQENAAPAVFMPSGFTLAGGAVADESDFFDGVELRLGEDAPFTWSIDELGNESSGLVWVKVRNASGRVDFACLAVDADEEITLPREIVEQIDATGILTLEREMHVAWEARVDTTRLDLLGVVRKRAPYTVITP